MDYRQIEQYSQEYWDLKAGKISGTRFSEVLSGRDNMIVAKLIDERLNGIITPDDYVSDDMQFGIDNESIALDEYELMSGIKFDRGGVIISRKSAIHMSSPDGISECRKKIGEVKCTKNGALHIHRFLNGIESSKRPQIVNYFACDDEVEEVHLILHCPFRPERRTFPIIYTRDTLIKIGTKEAPIEYFVDIGNNRISEIESEIEKGIKRFTHFEF